jgi:hypothetical protein
MITLNRPLGRQSAALTEDYGSAYNLVSNVMEDSRWLLFVVHPPQVSSIRGRIAFPWLSERQR